MNIWNVVAELLVSVVIGFAGATFAKFIIGKFGGELSNKMTYILTGIGAVIFWTLLQMGAINVFLNEVLTLIFVGAIAGVFSGMLITGKREGFGFKTNVSAGVIGALIGGFLFNLFNINFGLVHLELSVQYLVAAFVGAAGLMLLMRLFNKQKA